MDDRLLTVREVAEFLQLSVKTVYDLAAARVIPSIKIGGSRRFRRSDLEAVIEQGLRSPIAV